jgi:hypothetical protein
MLCSTVREAATDFTDYTGFWLYRIGEIRAIRGCFFLFPNTCLHDACLLAHELIGNRAL